MTPTMYSEDRMEFESAVLGHLDELYATSVRLTRSHSDADDLLQEAVMRAWAFFPRFEPGTNGRAWMHRILMNTFINGYRRKKREREVMSEAKYEARRPAWWEGDEASDDRDGLGDEVEAALSALPDEFKSVVILVDFNDLTYKEVSRALGCPIGTVMSRLHRARRMLKQRLRTYAVQEGIIEQAA